MAHKKLTQDFVNTATAEAGKDRTIFWDTRKPGFGLMVTETGSRSYVVQYRANGRSRRMALKAKTGDQSGLNLIEAKKRADLLLGQVAEERDPLQERRKEEASAGNTLQSVAERYFKDQRHLRSLDPKKKLFERLIFKKFGSRDIASIRRREVSDLLDSIEEERGPRMASIVLAALSKLFNWYATKDDEFLSPIVKGMRESHIVKRTRALTDDEIRALWAATERGSLYDRYVRFMFLTATRPDEPGKMRRSELNGSNWVIPAARYKTSWKTKHDVLIPLSSMAQDELGKVPQIGRANDGFLFTQDGQCAMGGRSRYKRDLDERSGITGWQLRDLRRTARTLMSRCGVNSDHAERALGHVIGGVRGHYDVHEYGAEKLKAFEALAAQIDRIVNPQDNVVELRAAP
jgi:integrase